MSEGSAGPLRPTFRFAPSPNGFLHLGHALSAIVGHDMARRAGGRFLLRVEDIDPARSREPFVAAIVDDLRWLGLDWDGPVVRQSERFDLYRAAIAALDRLGVLYPCFATRGQIERAAGADPPRDPDGAPLYPGIYRDCPSDEVAARRAAGEPFALRLDMARALALVSERLGGQPLAYTAFNAEGSHRTTPAHPERWGDAVIVRKDTPTSYHLAVVVDDANQGVTHVTRGRDLEAATDLHRLLQVLLGLPAPAYHHHRLLTDMGGAKLAKSRGSTALRDLGASGWSPADVRHAVAVALADV